MSGSATARVIVRLRPMESISDLDLDAIQGRLEEIKDLHPELIDSRLSDAPYVTVIAQIDRTQALGLERLKRALRDMPGVATRLYIRPGKEIELEAADLSSIQSAADADAES